MSAYHLFNSLLIFQASRDITNLAKKTIFLLHRIALEEPVPPNEDEQNKNKRAAECGYEKLGEVQNIYAKLKPELEGEKYWRYQRQVSPGVQEYVEALSFAHYLEHGSLITFDAVQQTLMDPQGNQVCSTIFPITLKLSTPNG